jgi:hypothetical protein
MACVNSASGAARHKDLAWTCFAHQADLFHPQQKTDRADGAFLNSCICFSMDSAFFEKTESSLAMNTITKN